MQSLRETSQGAMTAAKVESMRTSPLVAPSLPSVATTEMADSFLSAVFQKNHRTQRKLMLCCCKNTSALAVPAQVPGC